LSFYQEEQHDTSAELIAMGATVSDTNAATDFRKFEKYYAEAYERRYGGGSGSGGEGSGSGSSGSGGGNGGTTTSKANGGKAKEVAAVAAVDDGPPSKRLRGGA
jgi:hypothetical protein